MVNIIGVVEALEELNQRLQRPISRQAFTQSVLPELVRSGVAVLIGHAYAIDAEAWGQWCDYIVERERRIISGEWASNRPYSAAEMQALKGGDGLP